ncbi:hypothetical protein ACGO3R_12100 [Lactococcus lactis]
MDNKVPLKARENPLIFVDKNSMPLSVLRVLI